MLVSSENESVVRGHVLVAASREYQHDGRALFDGVQLERRERMGGFERGNYPFELRELDARLERLAVGDAHVSSASRDVKVRVHGTYARIVESGRDAVRFFDLTVRGLHEERLAPVQNAG